MKKFREKKRYYRNLLNNDLNKYFCRIDYNAWFDFWHDHPDWNGRGNISKEHRELHLAALLRRFKFLQEKLSVRSEGYQLFAIINIKDSSQDSVFVHTENPNADNYPVKYERFNGQFSVPEYLHEFLINSGLNWFIHMWDFQGEVIPQIFVYNQEAGIPIEKQR